MTEESGLEKETEGIKTVARGLVVAGLGGGCGKNLLTKKGRPPGHIKKKICFQKVVGETIREPLVQVCRFPRFPRPPQKSGLVVWKINAQSSFYGCHIG